MLSSDFLSAHTGSWVSNPGSSRHVVIIDVATLLFCVQSTWNIMGRKRLLTVKATASSRAHVGGMHNFMQFHACIKHFLGLPLRFNSEYTVHSDFSGSIYPIYFRTFLRLPGQKHICCDVTLEYFRDTKFEFESHKGSTVIIRVTTHFLGGGSETAFVTHSVVISWVSPHVCSQLSWDRL